MVNGQSSIVLQVDCLEGLAQLPDASIDLIYLDPPFNTGVKRAYNDAFGGPADYIAYMRPRLAHMQRVLARNGSLFFHCDWRTSHYVKVMLDDLFGVHGPRKTAGVFVNEIIWHYGLGAARARRNLLTKHDVIFWYARSAEYTFNQQRGEPTGAMLRKYCHTDEQGRRYMMSYGKRYYLKGGKPLDDVWAIPSIAPTSAERNGYPTQKPQVLLQRIVQLASNPGDLVLDPFCGSGSTLVAAKTLGRRWIGMDISEEAVRVARGRVS